MVVALNFPAAIRHKPAVRCEPLLQAMRDLAPVLSEHTRALRPGAKGYDVGWLAQTPRCVRRFHHARELALPSIYRSRSAAH
jgi:hypothetical protein